MTLATVCRLTFLTAMSGLPACAFSIDSGLVKPDEADAARAEDDASASIDGESPEPDATEPEPDATEPESDASKPAHDASLVEPATDAAQDDSGALPDTGTGAEASVTPDADSAAPLPSCTLDEECSAETFCSVDRVCVARCEPQRGCAGPRLDDVADLMSDEGDRVLLAVRSTRDAFGNVLADGAIWSWDEGGVLERLVTNLSAPDYFKLQFVADGSLYFRANVPAAGTIQLMRAKLESGANASALSNLPAFDAWTTSNYVWWSTVDGSHCNLQRIGRNEGAQVELVRSVTVEGNAAQAPCFVAGDEQHVAFGKSWFGKLEKQSIDGTSSTDLAAMPGTPDDFRLVASSLCLRGMSSSPNERLLALDWQAPAGYRGVGGFIGSVSEQPAYLPGYRVLGHWAYWIAVSYTRTGQEVQSRLQLARSRIDLSRSPEVFSTFVLPFNTTTRLAVTHAGTRVTYYNTREKRPFTLAVASLPCDAALPCPAGHTCQSDQTCR